MSNIQDAVKEKYGAAAKQVTAGKTACCGGGAQLSGCDPITRNLYDASEKAALPADAVAASLGCGNPTALAELKPGEIVLDLGSGGGIDVLLSAKRVGPAGKAYGVDSSSVSSRSSLRTFGLVRCRGPPERDKVRKQSVGAGDSRRKLPEPS